MADTGLNIEHLDSGAECPHNHTQMSIHLVDTIGEAPHHTITNEGLKIIEKGIKKEDLTRLIQHEVSEYNESEFIEKLTNLVNEGKTAYEILLRKREEIDHTDNEEVKRINEEIELLTYRYCQLINILIKDQKLPINKRFLAKDIFEFIATFKKFKEENGEGTLSMGSGTYLANSFTTQLEDYFHGGIIEHFSVITGSKVNFQDNVQLLREDGKEFEKGDKLDVKLNIGARTAIPHDVKFIGIKDENGKYSINITMEHDVFATIGGTFYSGCKIGKKSAFGFNFTLKKDSILGTNTVAGQRVTVEEGVNIGDNCALISGTTIRNGYETISYEDYMNGEIPSHGNYIVKLSKNQQEFEEQLKNIGTVTEEQSFYHGIYRFRHKMVQADNEKFSAMQVLMKFAYDTVENQGKFYQKEENSQYSLTLTGYPTNSEDELMFELIPAMLQLKAEGKAGYEIFNTLKGKINKTVKFPEIGKNVTFSGRKNTIDGSVKLGMDGGEISITDTRLRGDEGQIVIEGKSRFENVTGHGAGPYANNCEFKNMCLHGTTNAKDSKIIGESFSVVNSCEIDNVTAEDGDVTLNGSRIRNTILHGQSNHNMKTIFEGIKVAA